LGDSTRNVHDTLVNTNYKLVLLTPGSEFMIRFRTSKI
jgi:hypothetical protein